MEEGNDCMTIIHKAYLSSNDIETETLRTRKQQFSLNVSLHVSKLRHGNFFKLRLSSPRRVPSIVSSFVEDSSQEDRAHCKMQSSDCGYSATSRIWIWLNVSFSILGAALDCVSTFSLSSCFTNWLLASSVFNYSGLALVAIGRNNDNDSRLHLTTSISFPPPSPSQSPPSSQTSSR